MRRRKRAIRDRTTCLARAVLAAVACAWLAGAGDAGAYAARGQYQSFHEPAYAEAIGDHLFVISPADFVNPDFGFVQIFALDGGLLPLKGEALGTAQVDWIDAQDLMRFGDVLIAVGDEGLLVVDVSDPAAPVQLAMVSVPGLPRAVDFRNSRVYVASEDDAGAGGGLHRFEFADPANPTPAGSLFIAPGLRDVRIVGTNAFVTQDGPDRLKVIRLTGSLAEIGEVAASFVEQVDVVGDVAYTVGGEQLRVFDVSDPTAPALVQSLPVAGARRAIVAEGGHLYVGTDQGSFPEGLRVFETSTPLAPTLVATLMDGDARTAAVSRAGSHAYLFQAVEPESRSRTLVIDVSDPTAPFALQALESSGDGAAALVAGEGFLYHADGLSLVAVDVANPDRPTPTTRVRLPEAATSIAPRGQRVFTGSRDAVRVFEQANAWTLEEVASVTPADFGLTGQEAFSVLGLGPNHAYVGLLDAADQLGVIDVADPLAPVAGVTVALAGEVSGPSAIRVDGAVASVELHELPGDGIQLLDLSDPAQPVVGGVFQPAVSFIRRHLARDGLLYVLSWTAGVETLHVVDASDPQAPLEIGSLGGLPFQLGTGFALRGDALHHDGYGTIDVSDPTAPVLVSPSPFPDRASVLVTERFLYTMRNDPDENDLRGVRFEVFEIQECSNGVDDDGDGAIDLADVGCAAATGLREDPPCQNGLDDDADGGFDFDGGLAAAGVLLGPADATCAGVPTGGESRGCGLGAELAPLLGLLLAGRRRSRAPRRR